MTGNVQNTKLFKGAVRDWRRSYQPLVQKDLDELLPELDWATLVSASRRLFSNTGIVKGAITQKAMYTVGNAWMPYSKSKDDEWKEVSQEWLRQWFNICDVTGRDMNTLLYLISVAVDRDADCFLLLTSTESDVNPYPQVQLIESHNVDSFGDTVVKEGKYKGYKITKGVIHSKVGRPIAYRVKVDDDRLKYKDIDANNLIHIKDDDWYSSKRGVPLFAHAVNNFRDMEESTEKELYAQLIISSLIFVEKNADGAADGDDAAYFNGCSVDGKPTCENFDDGHIRYMKSGDGSGIEVVDSNRPSVEFREFHKRIERLCLIGAQWPSQLLDNPDNVNTNRLAIRQSERVVQDRQGLLERALNRVVAYAISKAIKIGALPEPKTNDYWKFTYSKPAYISIDLSRDSSALREEYKLGMRNLTSIVTEAGMNIEEFMQERIDETIMRENLIKKAEEKHGIEIDRNQIQLLGNASLQQSIVEAANQPT